jgi:hypothetical protein
LDSQQNELQQTAKLFEDFKEQLSGKEMEIDTLKKAIELQNFQIGNLADDLKANQTLLGKELARKQQESEVRESHFIRQIDELQLLNDSVCKEKAALETALRQEKEQSTSAKARRGSRPRKAKTPPSTPSGLGQSHLPYLRKVLLQFFVQDGKTRDTLVPVILSVVGCDDDQIQGAIHQWTQSNQLINQAFRRFK